MPFVAAAEALNANTTDLAALAREQGPAPWRVPLVGADQMRLVLIAYPPGFVSVPHHHPHAVETFLVLDGAGEIMIGTQGYRAAPGTLLWSPAGVQHRIEVTGPSDLVFLASVGPNENRDDETIEMPR
jgi:mannose-6-phosphate isomerase-like protein (cupin superfamily)